MEETVAQILAREAKEAEELAEAEERGEVTPTPGQRARRQPTEATQVYSVRIPVDRLEDLRQLASRLDIPPSVLLRRWVIERLDRELAGESAAENTGLSKTELLDAVSAASKAAVLKVLLEAPFAAPSKTSSTRESTDGDGERYRDPSGPIRLGATRRLATELAVSDISADFEDADDVRSEHV